MSEQFILEYIPQRMKQLGYTNWIVRQRDLGIAANSQAELIAYNELFFIMDDPTEFIVESDYGVYSSNGFLRENAHEHKGQILISNTSGSGQRIKFIQVIIVN